MKAIGISRYGDASVIEHWEVPVPPPGPGEALVKVHYAGVNFMDVHTRQGKYATSSTYPVRLPVTLGMEGAGEVVDCGLGVSDVAVGDRVAWCLSWGSYAEFALVPVTRLALVPDDLGLDVAAASIFQGCTAHYLVHDVAKLRSGMTCLVHAASGAIAQLLIQMAKREGVRVLATTSSEAKANVARSRGAEAVFTYDHFADDVLAATDGCGADVTFDSLGAPTLRGSFCATRTRGWSSRTVQLPDRWVTSIPLNSASLVRSSLLDPGWLTTLRDARNSSDALTTSLPDCSRGRGGYR
jgi:NADPH2:quinone reductase